MALDLTLALVIALLSSVRATSASTAVSAVGIVSSLAFLWLAATEHVRSPHPSAILTLYLLASIPLDILRARTLWILDDSVVAAIFTTRLVLKAWLFALEVKEKRESLIKARHDFTSEETAGIINRAFLWWLNRLFLIGFRKPLVLGDLFPVDRELRFQPKDLMSQMQEDPGTISASNIGLMVYAYYQSVSYAHSHHTKPKAACQVYIKGARIIAIDWSCGAMPAAGAQPGPAFAGQCRNFIPLQF